MTDSLKGPYMFDKLRLAKKSSDRRFGASHSWILLLDGL